LKLLALIAIILCPAIAAFSQQTRPQPSARQLLDAVVAHLPAEPTVISGEIHVRKRRGTLVGQHRFEMHLDRGRSPAVARYVISDRRGKNPEQLTVTRLQGREPEFEYCTGSPPAPAEIADLSAPIRQTDISWTDLTLSFLWWREGAVVGDDRFKGRPCHVVDVGAPQGSEGGSYSRVRLWLDRDMHMLLRAEGYDAQDRQIRSLWVRSLKKLDDRWMIKSMEVQSNQGSQRTKVLVNEVRPEHGDDGDSGN
jgi:hypothetical protein